MERQRDNVHGVAVEGEQDERGYSQYTSTPKIVWKVLVCGCHVSMSRLFSQSVNPDGNLIVFLIAQAVRLNLKKL